MSRTIGVAVDSRIKPSEDADTRSIGDFCPCMLVLSSNRLARLDRYLDLVHDQYCRSGKQNVYIYIYQTIENTYLKKMIYIKKMVKYSIKIFKYLMCY